MPGLLRALFTGFVQYTELNIEFQFLIPGIAYFQNRIVPTDKPE
jgi:hypothetical protein